MFDDVDEGIKVKFKPYSEIIENLTNSFIYSTKMGHQDKDDVIDCELSKDAHTAIIILKNSDEYYKIHVVCSTTFKKQQEIKLRGEYIKAGKIIQNYNGSLFCVPYLRDGKFMLLVFDKKKKVNDVNLSSLMGRTDYIRPNDNLPYPMMDACFIDS